MTQPSSPGTLGSKGNSEKTTANIPKITVTLAGNTISIDGIESAKKPYVLNIISSINAVWKEIGMNKGVNSVPILTMIDNGASGALIRNRILEEIAKLSPRHAAFKPTEADMAEDDYHIQLEQAASTRTLGKSEGKKASSKKDKKRKQPRAEAHRRRPALSFAAQGSENAEIHDPLLDLRLPTITNLSKSTPDLLVYETVAAIGKFCQYHNWQEIAPDCYSKDGYVDVENLPNLLLKIRDHSGEDIDNLYDQWLHILNPVTA